MNKYKELYDEIKKDMWGFKEEEIESAVMRRFDSMAQKQIVGKKIEIRTRQFLEKVIDQSTYRWIDENRVQSLLTGKVFYIV